MNARELAGMTFGDWTVLEYIGGDKTPPYYKCKCKCGYIGSINAYKLLSRGDKQGCRKCRPAKLTMQRSIRWNGVGDLSGSKWSIIKHNANIRRIPIEITMEYAWNLFVKQNGKCALSGVNIKFSSGGKMISKCGTASLDRIDSKLGYIEGNVQWIHNDIQRMKSDLGQDNFIEMCKKVSKIH